ncbi:YqhG family protein [Salipaludibacillus sp. HK11]|uniref:YqhG family protein n=1 Tax=Salipaludibacillus sp. HK11 TaxID=3394320 RepID=UPI0039FB9FCA
MQQADIHGFLKGFFTEHDCSVANLTNSSFDVQLTNEMDKALMNRPFYWHYIEKMNGTPTPMKLTIETDSTAFKKSKGTELIHYGSPRLHQLFSFAMAKGKYGHYYENVKPKTTTSSLKPWIALNGKIVYQCHRKKEQYFSIGLNLINGEMLNDFHSLIADWQMNETISNLCFPLSPLIKPATGIQRIRNQLLMAINQENHQWAEEANQKMADDLLLLDRFYDGISPKPDSYDGERKAIITQYDPVISLKIINGALFYLNSHPMKRTV